MDRPRQGVGTNGQMDGEAGWWTTSGKIGLPSLARVMGVGRKHQDSRFDKTTRLKVALRGKNNLIGNHFTVLPEDHFNQLSL